MIEFIKQKDTLSSTINNACNELYNKIHSLDVEALTIDPFYKWYYKKCHLSRPIFSLQTSAKLLYEGILLTNKKIEDVVVMDYGAGLGTLYIIAKMIGVKQIIYNDLLPEFAQPAIEVDKAFGIIMDEYIIGDTIATCDQLKKNNIQCDLIVSRNVLEHIYNLKDFFSIIHAHQPHAILYNSTTANWKNPAAHIQHVLIHKRARKTLGEKKKEIIKNIIPTIENNNLEKLNNILLQYGSQEFYDAIENFKNNNIFPSLKKDYTNVCDETGNWAEHLLPYKKYIEFAPQYHLSFKPGFWDTNYSNGLKSSLGKILNGLTKLFGDSGVMFSSFFYVVALPKGVGSE